MHTRVSHFTITTQYRCAPKLVRGRSIRPLAYSFVALRSCLITVCAYRLLDFFMSAKLLPVLKARATAKIKILAANAQPIRSVDGAAINVSTLKKPNHHARS